MKLGTLVYVINDNKTLMLHRIKKENDCHNGLWVAPGGKIDTAKSESPEDCARREVLEETGLILENLKLAGFITFPDIGNSPFGDLWYVWLYKSTEFSGRLIDSPEGSLEWVDNNKVCELPMWEGDKIFTPLIYNDRLFSAVMLYDCGKFIDYRITYI